MRLVDLHEARYQYHPAIQWINDMIRYWDQIPRQGRTTGKHLEPGTDLEGIKTALRKHFGEPTRDENQWTSWTFTQADKNWYLTFYHGSGTTPQLLLSMER